MNHITFLIQVCSFCIPFILLCNACFKINLPKVYRYKQFVMPILTIIYCLVAIICLDMFKTYLYSEIETLTSTIFNLEKPEWGDEFNQNVNLIQQYQDELKQYTDELKIRTNIVLTCLLNTLFVVGFLVIKSLVLLLCRTFWNEEITRVTSIKYYTNASCKLTPELIKSLGIDTKKSKSKSAMIWILRPDYRQAQWYFRGFYYALFISSVLLFIISQVFYHLPVFQAAFYPVFGVLILGEIYAFLSGIDDVELYEDEEENENENESETTEIDKNDKQKDLRREIRNAFIERDLQDSYLEPVVTKQTSSGWHSALDTVENRDLADIAFEYFSYLESEGTSFDINYVLSALRLIQGQSVLICNPFYQDLTHYIMLPIMRAVMKYRKCLILPGRESAVEDIKDWMTEASKAFVGTSGLWRVDILTERPTETDIGILRPSDIYHLKLHQENAAFFQRVGVVLLVEPSHILATGQIGLSMIIHRMFDKASNDNLYVPPVFCACDRNCDGLVDVLSHTLRTNLTEVTATLGSEAGCSQMSWRAEGDPVQHTLWPGIARYLDFGTPLAAVAMKNAVNTVTWIGSEKFPVIDMKWFAGQYYQQICRYISMNASQAAFNLRFDVQANLWKGGIEPERFLIVEDEFRNLFELHRLYASRASSNIFVNVISENYILRDYMVANQDTFKHDPKAIPTIVPEFARTERNTALKLVMMMAASPLSEAEIAHEFILCGIPTTGSVYHTLQALLSQHCNMNPGSHGYDLAEIAENNGHNRLEKRYFIDQNNEIYDYAQNLKPAYFITEDENGHKHLLGAMLYGHVYQSYLPGQFVVHEGKYYEIRAITAESGVILRRAADHINHRNGYRQICRIALSDWQDETTMGARMSYSDISFQRGTASLHIQTDGYLELNDPHDFYSARFVTVNQVPARQYVNKSILRISLPNTTVRQRLLMCLMLNEIFTTTYPDSHAYIHALTDIGSFADTLEGNMKYIIHSFHTDDPDILADMPEDDFWQIHEPNDAENIDIPDENTFDETSIKPDIYIIEDSAFDLGLLVSVERYIRRYFEIMTDYLLWHCEQFDNLNLSLDNAARNEHHLKTEETTLPTPVNTPQPMTIWERIVAFFRNLFGTPPTETVDPAAEEAARQAELLREEMLAKARLLPPKPWLRLGYPQTPDAFDIQGLVEYMQKYGFDKNPLTVAREYQKFMD